MLIGGLQQHKIFSFLQCAQDNNCKNAGSTVPEITIFLLNCVLDNNKKEKWGVLDQIRGPRTRKCAQNNNPTK